MFSVDVEEARKVAYEAHKDHKRKYTFLPYTTHLEECVQILMDNAEDVSNEMICALYLHDTLEDTQLKKEVILEKFGCYVLNLVVELTDVYVGASHGNRQKRKELEKQRLATISPQGQTLKLADMLSNTLDIVKNDTLGFASLYVTEKEALLRVLTKGDKNLRKLCENAVTTSRFHIEHVRLQKRLQESSRSF